MKRAFLTFAAILIACTSNSFAENREATPYQCRDGLGNTAKKLRSGAPASIAYLGGSITEQKGWRVLTQAWLQEHYSQATHVEIQAAIGGTPSGLGAFRVQRDVIQFAPDLVFVEFAVNDAKTPAKSIRESMEGIVRKIWTASPETDICFVYTISEPFLSQTEGGKYFANAASAMEEVAEHYNIPTIYMGYEVPKLAAAGTLLLKTPKPQTEEQRAALEGKILFASDGVHPHVDTGHPVYFKQVKQALPVLLAKDECGPHHLPAALEPNNYEDSQMIPLSQVNLQGDWQQLDKNSNPVAQKLSNRVDELWRSDSPDATISLKFKGTHIGIYAANGPDCGNYTFTLNSAVRNKSKFDQYSTYHRIGGDTFATNMPDTVHSFTISPLDTPVDKEAILAKGGREADFQKNPNKYKDNYLYISAIVIRGELIEE